MKLLQRFYLPESEALALGLTHHGSLFGIPAFLSVHPEYVYGVPKIPALDLVTHFLDTLLGIATYFIPAHVRLKSPIRVGAAIKAAKGE